MVSIEATPVKAPADETTRPDELMVSVSSVPLPMVMVFAATPVPTRTEPVVPESRVKFDEVVVEIVPAPAKVRAVADVAIVSIEATPVRAPPDETTKPEEFIVKVSSVPLPMVMVFAATPVPINTDPVEPESTVIEDDVVEEIVPAPAKVRAVADEAIVSIDATPVKAPPVVRFKPVEAKERASSVSPIVIVSASVLVPMVMVSQPAELQTEAEVAFVLPKVRAPAVERSKLLANIVPVVVMLSAPVSIAPKPEVIEPASRAPVPVIAVATASLVSTRAAS